MGLLVDFISSWVFVSDIDIEHEESDVRKNERRNKNEPITKKGKAKVTEHETTAF